MNKTSLAPFKSNDAEIRCRAKTPANAGNKVIGNPFLKWVGSKRRLLPQLLPLLPSGRRLVEPFVGAGSVFMATDFSDYLLADTNATLMTLYSLLQCEPERIGERASAYFVEANCNQQAYNQLRARFNSLGPCDEERAALFIYLNKFAFNGLYRVNQRGEMNAPFAHHTSLPSYPAAAMSAFAYRLARATLQCSDYEHTLSQAVFGDVVYCDPPYLSLESGSGPSFTSYSKSGFGIREHEKLALTARVLAARGIPVVISNHDSSVTRNLYEGAEIHEIDAYRSVSGKSPARGKAPEIVAIFRPDAEKGERYSTAGGRYVVNLSRWAGAGRSLGKQG